MEHLADRLDQAADTLAAVDRRMPGRGVAAAAFGADDAGLPGRLGRALYAHWAAVLDARSHEAASAAARLTEAAVAVRAVRAAYDETDDVVRRRFAREV
jgi:hypothetical protein